MNARAKRNKRYQDNQLELMSHDMDREDRIATLKKIVGNGQSHISPAVCRAIVKELGKEAAK